MILINDNWEKVEDLSDVSRVIREYYNSELAGIVDDLNVTPAFTDDDYWELEVKLGDCEDQNSILEDELSFKEGQVEKLEEEIEELKETIWELEQKIVELESR